MLRDGRMDKKLALNRWQEISGACGVMSKLEGVVTILMRMETSSTLTL